jgi:type I restriction enzyme R subunit
MGINESIAEDAALEWFGEQGYSVGHGGFADGTLAPALSHGEREANRKVALVGRLREAIRRLIPAIPEEPRATRQKSLAVQTHLEKRAIL